MSAPACLATIADAVDAVDAFDAAVDRAAAACERHDLLALSRALDDSDVEVARVAAAVATIRDLSADQSAHATKPRQLQERLTIALRRAAQLAARLQAARDEARHELQRLGHEAAAVRGYGRTGGPAPKLDQLG